MKKRILLILALGVSFTPAIFASGSSFPVGENDHKTVMKYAPESVRCNSDPEDEKKISANVGDPSGQARKSTSSTARLTHNE